MLCFQKSSTLTSAVGSIQGLVSLYEDVARLEGNQNNFFQQSVWKLSLHINILFCAGVLIKVSRWNLQADKKNKTNRTYIFLGQGALVAL